MLGEGTPHDTSKGMQYSYECPLCHDHKERLFVNIDRKVYFCHNCNSTGTIISFIMEYNSIAYKDALSVYREYEGYEAPLPEQLEEEIKNRLVNLNTDEIEPEKYIYPLPDEFIPIEEARGESGKKAVKYLKSRGVTLGMAERYYIGYCAEGKYKNRIVMPDFEDYELIYWQARTWEPEPILKPLKKYYRKVLNPSEGLLKGVRPIDKSQVISNIDFIREQGIAVLCEGKMDGYTIGDTGGCLHGKILSDDQFIKLVRNRDKIQAIFIMLDGDAFEYAMNIAQRLSGYFDDIFICKIPNDQDPNKLGRKKCLEYIDKAEKYTPMFFLKARIKGWI